MQKTESIALEMSLKPFKKTDCKYIEAICKNVFEQWRPLIKEVPTVKIMLWTADGSELFDYSGNLDDSFEWAYFFGGANQREADHSDIDPEGQGLHSRHYKYIKNPPVMTYKILKFIVDTLRETGNKILPDKKIKIGTTVDVGPKFAISDFKYSRHNELCVGNAMGKGTMLCAYNKMHADNFAYATYPNGVPEGLPFGTFFGKQAQRFMNDIGFDYIWFSNGLGFGRDTWTDTGAVFDGKNFNAGVVEDIQKDVIDFWKLFRKECPDYPIETRGTNMSLGIDNATDGVPLKAIYDNVSNILPPPNSPWAALNGNYGLELMGYMSRVAHIPSDRFLFRFYFHDIWWMNSPWYDRYNGQPHDIYLPLAISRIDKDGKIGVPSDVNILSIDNSYGDMPDSCAYECIPHLRKALREAPDAPSPLVWVYPFNEYSESTCEENIRAMYYEDKFIEYAINEGIPLSTVTATDSFAEHDKGIYKSSVIIAAAPFAGTKFESEVIDYVKNGGKVIFYGDFKRSGEQFKAFRNEYKAYNTEWIEFGGTEENKERCCKLFKDALRKMNYSIVFDKENGVESPKLTIHRFNNAYIFSQYSPNTTVETKIRFPFGAPILDCWTAKLESGFSCYHFPKSERKECRAFVEQEKGSVNCSECPPVSILYRRSIHISGLENATVRILAENYCKDNVHVFRKRRADWFYDEQTGEYEKIGSDIFYRLNNVSGQLYICMPHKADLAHND